MRNVAKASALGAVRIWQNKASRDVLSTPPGHYVVTINVEGVASVKDPGTARGVASDLEEAARLAIEDCERKIAAARSAA